MTPPRILSLSLFLLPALAQADPRISSWFTERSGAYARIYETDADQVALNAVTTWNRGDGVQEMPTYAGIHEISHTQDWVYIRTTNLASHIMGPWYGNAARTNLFPSYPANQAVLYRLPRDPADPSTFNPKTLTGGGPIGYFVNGVSMFDSRDAFSYDSSAGTDANGRDGDGAWNRDAYVNEGVTFDAGNAHQAGGRYHYHADPPGLRHQLGDSVDYTASTNTYTENFNGGHSPILAWVRDGIPVYGPYGYSNPLDPASPVSRMRSGYQLRTDIAPDGSPRDDWPAWADRVYAGLVTFADGPAVSAAFPLGRYMEDNDYKGDLGMTLGVDFDLNEYNVRYCVTPEYPSGTWAYFVCIDDAGTPVFPYNIARAFFGEPVGDVPNGLPDSDEGGAELTTVFEGGPELAPTMESLSVNDPNPGEVTILWNAVEGGSYEVKVSSDLGVSDPWTAIAPPVVATADRMGMVDAPGGGLPERRFYSVDQLEIAPFDDAGFAYDSGDPPPPGTGPVSITVDLSGGPADLNALPTQLTFDGQQIDVASANVSRSARREITFDIVTYGMAPGDYAVTAQFPAGPLRTGTYTIHPSVLLMIVDDWGHDASPLDNTTPGAVLANMPNLQALADAGLRFTRAYSQPTCSPMRATMLTGRQPFQHGVGSPEVAGQFAANGDEITLPDIFTSMAPHDLLTVGKWHLGGNDDGYSDRGGWPEFYGISGGGVGDYFSWNKNSNGTTANTTTYSTTDQVNEATAFIDAKVATGTPWFAWVAFNAPHSPFHEPPAELAPEGGYSPIASGESTTSHNYRMMLEALDTEIGRLLASVDPAQTNIILIGDNGTPGQVVQAPYGNGRAKGALYNGGIHVPLIAKGPAVTVPAGSTTDTLVHCADMFSTILELVGIDESAVAGLAAQDVRSTSMVPIFNGTDSADRCVVAERSGGGVAPGRAIMVDDYPEYKLIINGDPGSTIDTPTFEFFNTGPSTADVNEQSPLDIASLSGEALDAYNALRAKDLAFGGGYSDAPSNFDTLYIQLPDSGVDPAVPNLTRGNGNPVNVESVTVDGAPAVVIGRLDSGAVLADEGDDVAAQHWVKVRLAPAGGGPYTSARVIFPDTNAGEAREYDSVGAILVNSVP